MTAQQKIDALMATYAETRHVISSCLAHPVKTGNQKLLKKFVAKKTKQAEALYSAANDVCTMGILRKKLRWLAAGKKKSVTVFSVVEEPEGGTSGGVYYFKITLV